MPMPPTPVSKPPRKTKNTQNLTGQQRQPHHHHKSVLARGVAATHHFRRVTYDESFVTTKTSLYNSCPSLTPMGTTKLGDKLTHDPKVHEQRIDRCSAFARRHNKKLALNLLRHNFQGPNLILHRLIPSHILLSRSRPCSGMVHRTKENGGT